MFAARHGTLRPVGLESGDRLGRYQILCPLASGGMATVYAARVLGEGAFQKPVALKLMLPHLARDEKFVAMFMDEAALAAQIESPHVVATHDLGREGGETLYMALELVLGSTLRELGDAAEGVPGGIPLDVALTILVQAARGLEDAHRARSSTGEALDLVHRDVSPHNVLVGIDGRARISDFGIARAMARNAQTETGELKGKLAYFSPEQLRGLPIDQRSDVFALGVVAWELLAGRRLFEADNPLLLADRIVNAPIRHLDTVRRDLPPGVAGAVAAALLRDPEKRLASAAIFADRLVAAMAAGGSGQASPARVGQVVRALGGERVQLLEKRITTLFRELPLPASADATGVHHAQTADAQAFNTQAANAQAASTQGATGSGVVIVRTGPTPLALGVAGTLLALGVAGAVYAFLRGGTTAVPTAPPTLAAPSIAPAAPAVPDAPSPSAPAAPSPIAPTAPVPDAPSPIAPGATPAAVPAADALAAPAARGARPRGAPRTATPREAAPEPATAAPTASVPAPPATARVPTPAGPAPAPRGGLVGVDEFDGDDGNH